VAEDGELRFHGPNAYVGVWRRHEGLDRRSPDDPVHTGDLVRRNGDDLYFEGRKDTSFSLSNGRLVPAGALEGRLKRAHPTLHDALLYTPNGTNVALALCADSAAAVPSEEALRDTLGALGARLVRTTVVPPDDWAQRPKGTVDRAAMTDRLRTGAPPPGSSPDAS
jgi:acyl-CoA synthetase (AMP-forming)/AMP-acid ligase II